MKLSQSIHDLTQQNVAIIAQIEEAFKRQRTLGELVADGVAETVGSWPFIIVQSLVLAAWMGINVVAWFTPWDPYPFILLNLVLSFQAAFSSPIIMMSQNRQAYLSERRHKLDLQINLLSEQENTATLKLLHRLCEKMDIDFEDEETPVKTLEQSARPEEMIEQIADAERSTKDSCPSP